MGLVEHAKAELALLRGKDREPDETQDIMDSHLLKMVEVFADEGHSGFSAGYAMQCLERLLRFLPLTSLTGDDDEWVEVYTDDDGIPVYQNKRCSEIFRKNGKAHTIRGKVFSDDGGETWWTSKDSHVDIDFPYAVPLKPEYVVLGGDANANP